MNHMSFVSLETYIARHFFFSFFFLRFHFDNYHFVQFCNCLHFTSDLPIGMFEYVFCGVYMSKTFFFFKPSPLAVGSDKLLHFRDSVLLL